MLTVEELIKQTEVDDNRGNDIKEHVLTLQVAGAEVGPDATAQKVHCAERARHLDPLLPCCMRAGGEEG